MKTKILTLLTLIAIIVASCQKEETVNPVTTQDVSFSISEVDPYMLKSDPDSIFCPTDDDDNLLVPTIAEIEIGGNTYYPAVFYLNDKLYTQSIKLDIANKDQSQIYTVTKFVLWTEHPEPNGIPNPNAKIVMAAPNSGAAFAEYITEDKRMSFDIEIDAFSKKEFDIEVLCFLPRHYENFGFFWFQVTEIVVREQCFFGDFCVKDPNDLAGSWYENQYNGDLLIDMPAIFKIHVFDNGVEVPNSPFTNASMDANWGVGSPVCVQYPDNLGEVNNFEFVLYIHVPVGDVFDWVEFHTWNITDDEEFFDIAEDGVVDFVLGNCVYSDTDLLLAPYMNLPETALIDLIFDQRQGPGYWELDIQSVNPNGSYDLPTGYMAGWCGDANTQINEKKYTFHVYSSLYPASWPIGLPASFDVNKINQINWLFNNLGSYGFTISGLYIEIGELSQDDGLVIQDAVWTIMHGPAGFTPNGGDITLSQTMALAASTHGTFSPLPGGWAAIILVPEDEGGVPDATKAQLILTVVDP